MRSVTSDMQACCNSQLPIQTVKPDVIFFERENPSGKSVLEVLRKLTGSIFRSFLWFSIQSVHV